MTFWTKTFVQLLLLSFTVISSIVGGLTWMEGRNDRKIEKAVEASDQKVESARKELMTNIRTNEELSNAKINSLDVKFVAEIGGLKTQLGSMDGKIDLLISLSRKLQAMADAQPNANLTHNQAIISQGRKL